LAGLKELISPFSPVRTFSSRSVRIDAPEVVNLESDLICGTIQLRSSVEQYPLIQAAVIEELPLDKTISLQCEIVDAIDGIPVFDTLVEFHPDEEFFLSLLTPVGIDDLPDDFLDNLSLPSEIEISGNLSRQIYPPQEVMGMNYASRYWEVTKVQLPGFQTRREEKKGGKPIRSIQRGQIGSKPDKHSLYKPSFWDFLFVLLQPPLALDLPESLALPHDLYKYQVKGVKFLISNQQALLADDMGTGKTVMTLVALKLLMQQAKVHKALIVCPPSVLHEWRRHLDEWTPELVTTFVRGQKELRKLLWGFPSHVYVTAYSTLRNDVRSGLLPKDYKKQFDVVVIDEAHHIKNPNTAQSRSVKTLDPNYRWALTGTPVQNKLEDMHALFEFVYPGLLTSFDTEERVKIKIAPHFLRRRKQEVMADLPPKIRQELELDLDPDQQKAYEQVERESRLEIAALGDRVTKQHIFAKLILLKQICNFAPGKITSPKLEDLIERVEEIIQSGQKVFIFSQYRGEGIDKIERSLKPYNPAKIVGGQSDAVRGAEIERFKYRDDTPILLASRSGGEGLNLVEASYVILFDHWWNPAVMWQAEDRAHRHGQKNSVNIYSYWMLDTIDIRIREILERKGLLIDNVVDGLADKYKEETDIDEMLSKEDLLEILGIKPARPQKPKFDTQAWRHLNMQQIHQKLFEIEPYEFEDLIQKLMHYLGFPNVKVTKRSGDGGVDVLSARNTGKGVERIAAQCKRYKGMIGVKIAREFLGAIQDDPTIVKGYLITTSDFTAECIAFCNRNGIEMIPGLQVAQYVRMFSLAP